MGGQHLCACCKYVGEVKLEDELLTTTCAVPTELIPNMNEVICAGGVYECPSFSSADKGIMEDSWNRVRYVIVRKVHGTTCVSKRTE